MFVMSTDNGVILITVRQSCNKMSFKLPVKTIRIFFAMRVFCSAILEEILPSLFVIYLYEL